MWQDTKQGLHKQFKFNDFKAAFAFMTAVAALAEQRQHHPRWENQYNVVDIWLSTHEQGGAITDQDRSLATAIDELTDRKPQRHVKLYSDGGSRGNPGPSASGYVLLDKHDQLLLEGGLYLGVTTNNLAEYMALKLALEAAQGLGARQVDCYLDSLLVVNQMQGIFKIKNRDLWPVHNAIKELVQQFKHVSFTHVPREHNTLADAVVNRVLNDHAASA